MRQYEKTRSSIEVRKVVICSHFASHFVEREGQKIGMKNRKVGFSWEKNRWNIQG